MKDHYKTLSINFGATVTEIKKQFRKLATVYHPDKNGGSKKSEEIFKEILNAYEILSDKQKRLNYDNWYKQYFQQTKAEQTNTTKTEYKQSPPPNTENSKYSKTDFKQSPPPPKSKKQQKTDTAKRKPNYSFWVMVVLFVLLYLYKNNKATTTINEKADQELGDQQPNNRPQSGELNFNK